MATPEKEPKQPTYGPGGLGDQYDNDRMKSLDRSRRGQGDVTGAPLEEDMDLTTEEFVPDKGEAYLGEEERYMTDSQDDLERSPIRMREDHLLRGPKNYKQSDEGILDKVAIALHRSHEVDASDLEISVKDQCVYLKGTLPDKRMRYLAEDLVEDIPGVRDVFTQIRIKPSSY